MRLKNFGEANTALRQYVPPRSSMFVNYKLDRMRALMAFLGNPQDQLKVIHVAGTSGKSSTCYYLAALLQAAGQKVGLTISPHVDEVNERVQINLTPLPEAEFCRELGEFLELVEKSQLEPTYFEILVAFAYWEFARRKVGYAVVEVGLGGLLDGTNVVTRTDKVGVVTDIGLAHTHVLGNTLAEIAAQKAGITCPENVIFSYQQAAEITDSIRATVAERGGELRLIGVPDSVDSLVRDLPAFQQRNWYLAKQVYEFVRRRDNLPQLEPKALAATTRTRIPGRLEIVHRGGKTIIMDAAHNPQKMQALAGVISDMFPGQPIAMLVSVIKDRDLKVRACLQELAGLCQHLVVTSFRAQQDFYQESVNLALITRYCRELGFADVEVIADARAAYQALLARPEPILLVTGSFYLLHNIRPIILADKDRPQGASL